MKISWAIMSDWTGDGGLSAGLEQAGLLGLAGEEVNLVEAALVARTGLTAWRWDFVSPVLHPARLVQESIYLFRF